MRDYARVAPSFWTGETGKAIRKEGGDSQRVAMYLVTCPNANMIGLFYIPISLLCYELGNISEEGALKVLQSLELLNFAFYSVTDELVFVPEMARFQIGERLHAEDNRVKGVAKELVKFRKSPFFKAFMKRYEKPFNLTDEIRKLLADDADQQAPSKPLRSQAQEQSHLQEHEQEKSPLPPEGAGSVAAEKRNSPKGVNGHAAEKRQSPDGVALPGFDRFWAEWPATPRKQGQSPCRRHWFRKELEPIAEQVITSLRRCKASSGWRKDGGQYIPKPVNWLKDCPWENSAETVAAGRLSKPRFFREDN
jgi:hypothetical protein